MVKKQSAYKKHQLRYAYAYVLSAALTLIVYALAVGGPFDGSLFVGIVLAFAGLQLYIQSRYFLHLDDNEIPHWRLMSYTFTWLTLLIIAVGSIWIMNHLNYNMDMTPQQMDKYMEHEGLRGF